IDNSAFSISQESRITVKKIWDANNMPFNGREESGPIQSPSHKLFQLSPSDITTSKQSIPSLHSPFHYVFPLTSFFHPLRLAGLAVRFRCNWLVLSAKLLNPHSFIVHRAQNLPPFLFLLSYLFGGAAFRTCRAIRARFFSEPEPDRSENSRSIE
ncbi:unnamed protein product, partial [Sphenostylis stenocarpa]